MVVNPGNPREGFGYTVDDVLVIEKIICGLEIDYFHG
jgi:hypothetical protein